MGSIVFDLEQLEQLLLSKDGVATSFRWMKAGSALATAGEPTQFDPRPFIADRSRFQQGYID